MVFLYHGAPIIIQKAAFPPLCMPLTVPKEVLPVELAGLCNVGYYRLFLHMHPAPVRLSAMAGTVTVVSSSVVVPLLLVLFVCLPLSFLGAWFAARTRFGLFLPNFQKGSAYAALPFRSRLRVFLLGSPGAPASVWDDFAKFLEDPHEAVSSAYREPAAASRQASEQPVDPSYPDDLLPDSSSSDRRGLFSRSPWTGPPGSLSPLGGHSILKIVIAVFAAVLLSSLMSRMFFNSEAGPNAPARLAALLSSVTPETFDADSNLMVATATVPSEELVSLFASAQALGYRVSCPAPEDVFTCTASSGNYVLRTQGPAPSSSSDSATVMLSYTNTQG